MKNFGKIFLGDALSKSGEENPNSHIISGTDEIVRTWFSGIESVGICGATSTPIWLMEEVAGWVNQNFN